MTWLLRLLSLFPLRGLQLLGAGLGSLAFRLVPVLKQRTNENLAQAGYNDPKLYLRAGRNIGRQALESCWIWYRDAEEVCSRVTVAPEVVELFDQAIQENRPIVFMAPHIGCFEVLPVWFAHRYYQSQGKRIAILFRPPKKDFLNKIVGESRQSPGIEACPTNLAGIKRAIRNLRQGSTFGVLPDQVPSSGDGAWTTWFGRKAYTMTLPMRVAKQFDAIRIFAWSSREGHGWRLHACRWDEPLTGDIATDAQKMNDQIEAIIRTVPEQYGWSYNRYKVPSGARAEK